MDVGNKTYHVSFKISHSFLPFTSFMEFLFKTITKMENLFVEEFDSFGYRSTGKFWQENRRCNCGSHFFENGSTASKVKCSKCGEECDIQ